MKVLVAVKRVVDYKAVIRIKSDGTAIETSNVKMSMNPFDEIALEEAVRLKEKGLASEIIVTSIGHEACQETLRTALAMGADKGILIQTETTISSLTTAKALKQLAQQEAIQLILLGKQAIDTDNSQTGPMLAGLLNWPQGTFASALRFHDAGVSVTREIDGGLETLFLTLPAVITADLRLNEPRYLSLPNIVQAKKKPIITIPLISLTSHTQSKTTLLKIEPPIKKLKGKEVADVSELVKCLREEARIIK